MMPPEQSSIRVTVPGYTGRLRLPMSIIAPPSTPVSPDQPALGSGWLALRLVRLRNNPLARAAFLLALSNGVAGLLGLAFWTIAARTAPTVSVGAASAFIAALGLVVAVAGLGLPEALIRYLPESATPRRLLAVSSLIALALAVLGGGLLGLLPSAAPIDPNPLIRGLLGLLTAPPILFFSLASAALLVARRTGLIFLGSLGSGAGKVLLVALVALVGLSSPGALVGAYAGGALVGALIVGTGLRRVYSQPDSGGRSIGGLLRPLRAYAATNLTASGVSLIPISLAPSLLAARAGVEAAAFAAVPLMLLAFLTLIPSVIARSLFGEGSRDPAASGHLGWHSLRVALALEVIVVLVTILAAPTLLGALLGSRYEESGATLLQLLALASAIAVPNYIIDVLLNIRRDKGGFALVNVGGTALILTALFLFANSPTGLGVAWIVGQSGYLALAGSVLFLHSRPRGG